MYYLLITHNYIRERGPMGECPQWIQMHSLKRRQKTFVQKGNKIKKRSDESESRNIQLRLTASWPVCTCCRPPATLETACTDIPLHYNQTKDKLKLDSRVLTQHKRGIFAQVCPPVALCSWCPLNKRNSPSGSVLNRREVNVLVPFSQCCSPQNMHWTLCHCYWWVIQRQQIHQNDLCEYLLVFLSFYDIKCNICVFTPGFGQSNLL